MRDQKQVQELQQQVKAAWAKLPKDLQERLEPKIRAAHQFAVGAHNRTIAPACSPNHQLSMIYSMLYDDPDGILRTVTGTGGPSGTPGTAAMAPEGIFTHVGSDGEVYFGGVDYDSTDPGWAYVLVALAETLGQTPPFKLPPNYPAQPAIAIPDNATLAILGDWGGANAPAQQVAASVAAAKPDYVIHQGNVYYAGTNGTGILKPYESDNFVNVWPGKPGASFALNSNHDMYAHATGYSLTALAAPAFKAQQGANVFTLSNKSFRIVGLDSAYYATDDMYDTGSLGASNGPQALYLQFQAKAAAAAGQTLIVMTHHNGLAWDGSSKMEPLWNDVVSQIGVLSGKSVIWYWGHVHIGALYQRQMANGIAIYPRCCGHSCIPWGVASGLQNNPNVPWFEKEVLKPGPNYFVTNGYSTLALSGASLTEAFFDQSGNVQWQSKWTAEALAA